MLKHTPLKFIIILTTLSMLLGCGGSGGNKNSGSPGSSSSSNSSSGGATQDNVLIEFISPIQNANIGLGEDTTITLKLRVSSADEISGPTSIEAITENNKILLTKNTNNPNYWTGQLKISPGNNTISIKAESDSFSESKKIEINNELALTSGQGILYDELNNRLVLISLRHAEIFTVDLATGKIKAVTKNTLDGRGFSELWSGDWAIEGESIYVSDIRKNIIYEVDLDTGEKTIISSSILGSGPDLTHVYDIVHDKGNDRLFVSDGSQDAIYEVNTKTGDRTVVTRNDQVGEGANFNRIRYIAYDNVTDQLFATDRSEKAIFKIDRSTGNREIIASNTIGSGPALDRILGISLDKKNNRLLYTNYDLLDEQNTAGLMSLDLYSLERSFIISNSNQNSVTLIHPNTIASVKNTDHIYMGDTGTGAIYKVDTNSGEIEIAARASVGSGKQTYDYFRNLAISPNGRRLLGRDTINIMDINLINGKRTAIFTNTVNGKPTEGVGSFTVDWSSNAAFFADYTSPALVKVDLNTAEKIFIANDSVETPLLENALALEYDNKNQFIHIIDRTMDQETGIISNKLHSINPKTGEKTAVALISDQHELSPRYLSMPWNSNSLYISGSFLDNLNNFMGDALVIFNTTRQADELIYTESVVNSLGQIFDVAPYRHFYADQTSQRVISSIRGIERPSPQAIIASFKAPHQPEFLSDSTIGKGLPILAADDIVVDEINNRAFISDYEYGGIIMISLDSGDRMLITQ